MIVCVSTPGIKDKISQTLAANFCFDKWLSVPGIPFQKQKIISLLSKYGCTAKKGQLIFFVNRKKRVPADFPGLFIDNWLLSLVFYRDELELQAWLNALDNYKNHHSPKVLVLGMMKPFYMKWGNKIYSRLKKEKSLNGNTSKHLADNTTKIELAQKLSRGCALALYVGHGRSRGWSGYRGFRWEHMKNTTQSSPVGTLLSFACNGLKDDKRKSVPFGLQWIISGRACSSIAACESLRIKPLETIANAFLESVCSPGVNRVDELLFRMNEKIKLSNDPGADLNWQLFRLVGSPFQLLK